MKLNGNLTFLGGGIAENLRIDGFSADPAAPLEQQIWINSTDEKLRFFLNGKTITVGDTATLALEVDRIESAVGLDEDGNFVPFTGTNYLGSATSISSSLVALDGQIKTTADALAAEAARAQGVEGGLQSEIDTVEASAGLNADGTLAPFTGANYIASASSLRAAAVALDGQVKSNADAIAAETARAQGVEGGLDTRLTTVEASYVNKDGSVVMTGALDMGSHRIIHVDNPVDGGDAVNLATLESRIGSLGSAFEYVGSVDGGASQAEAFDLSTLTQKEAGDYYKVKTSGYVKLGEEVVFVNVGDGIVFNKDGGFDKIDNTNTVVSGTTNYISVTGSTDTGFVVDIDNAFKTTVSTIRTDLDAEVVRATTAEGQLRTDLNAEITRATNAEAALGGRIDGVASDLAAEISRAQAAEQAIQAELDTVETSVGLNADGTFTALTGTNYLGSATSVVGLSQALDGALKALSDRVVGSFFVYSGDTPATTHVVQHNLGTKYVNVTVIDANDQVIGANSITFDSSNQLTVGFNTAIACKVVVSGLKAA